MVEENDQQCNWSRYIVEFRGSYPHLRLSEFCDCVQYFTGQHTTLQFCAVIVDMECAEFPLCAYISLPSHGVAQVIAERCSLVRTIIEVWGDGVDSTTACQQALYFIESSCSSDTLNRNSSWKVTFRRYGRSGNSGVNHDDRRSLLDLYSPVLSHFVGEVDLEKPDIEILLLEDWHHYHQFIHEHIKPANSVSNSDITCVSTGTDIAATTAGRYILGRVVGWGPLIQTMFDLRHRPYLGTTSMKAIPSHVTAVAALIAPGDLVLDPFCGTCSLLVAAAHLGAKVVGSDYDGVGLGLKAPIVSPTEFEANPLGLTWNERRKLFKQTHDSKNSNFVRNNGSNQHGKSSVDNFTHYGLRDRLLELISCDVKLWLPPSTTCCYSLLEEDAVKSISKYDKFDAIIADPPYGKREKSHCKSASGSKLDEKGIYSDLSTSTGLIIEDVSLVLCQVAACRVKSSGRLVFWLPSKACVHVAQIHAHVQHILALSDTTSQLNIVRVTPEILNSSMWRWLCVLQRV